MYGGLLNHATRQSNTSPLFHFSTTWVLFLSFYLRLVFCVLLHLVIEPRGLVMCSFISEVHTKMHKQCIACFHNNHFFKAYFAICVNVTIYCTEAV